MNKKPTLPPSELSGSSQAILEERRSKQSVRTTIRLTQGTEEYLQSLAKEHGLKLKEAIDAVLFTDSFRESVIKLINQYEEFKASDTDSILSGKSYRKSIVITKRALESMNRLAKENGVTRDVLFEAAIFWLLELIEWGIQETHKKHEQALVLVKGLENEIAAVEKKLRDTLGDKDPITTWVIYLGWEISDLLINIRAELKDGSPIDDRWHSFVMEAEAK